MNTRFWCPYDHKGCDRLTNRPTTECQEWCDRFKGQTQKELKEVLRIQKFKELNRKMKVVYAQERIETEGPVIFIAGPSPRNNNCQSWRSEAVKLFEDFGFKGTLLVPEFRNTPIGDFHYDEQIEWEKYGMHIAEIVMFWVPRKLDTLPGFTTNIEFGYWLGKDYSKMRVGFPPDAENMRYIDAKCKDVGINCETELRTLIEKIVREF